MKWLVVLLVLAGVAVTPTAQCPCPARSASWQLLPDTASVTVPLFVWAADTIAVDQVVMCRHGVFFRVQGRNYRGTLDTFWVASPEPSLRSLLPMNPVDSLLDEHSIVDFTAVALAKASNSYTSFRTTLAAMLNLPAAPDRPFVINTANQPPGLNGTIVCEIPYTFYWDDQEAEFFPPDIYVH